MTDLEAMGLIHKGDLDAFEWLYKNNRQRVYSTCLRMTRDRSISEDLTQEAFMQAFRRLKSFRSESMFGTWLHRIAITTTLMYFRRQNTSLQAEQSFDGGPENGARQSPQERIGRRDAELSGTVDRLALQRAMDQLASGYRMVFILHDIEGYEHAEVAELLGCTAGNSKSQLHKARVALRKTLTGAPACSYVSTYLAGRRNHPGLNLQPRAA
jgi:RNA polymerase sigma-70 factor, ECF subfamily